MAEPLSTWNDGQTKEAIVEFVGRVTDESSADYRPVRPSASPCSTGRRHLLWWREADADRARVHPEAARRDGRNSTTSLRERQPWKAARDKDYAWLGGAINKHYAGDDSDVALLLGGIVQAFAGMTVDVDYADSAHGFLTKGDHPTLGRSFSACAYTPMIDLLQYLEAHGFSNFIASGGDRDFMRPVTEEIYGIPSERVIGSSNALGYEAGEHGGRVVYMAKPDFFDDGPVKPVRIWSRVRAPADLRRRELERRHRDAALCGRLQAPGVSPADRPRRRRARVRVQGRRRKGTRGGRRGRVDGVEHEGRLEVRLPGLLRLRSSRPSGVFTPGLYDLQA